MMAQQASLSLWEQATRQAGGGGGSSWALWAACAVGFVLSLLWAFIGCRGLRVLAIVQGALLGLAIGYWTGMAVEEALAAGSFTPALWLEVAGNLHMAPSGVIGALACGLLFALIGRVLLRVQFFLVGGFAGSLLLLLMLRLIGAPVRNPLPVAVAALLVAGTVVVLLSVRYPVVATGILGGVGMALALTWPMLRLFVHVGGPAWLPYLSSGGLGVLATIAGTALQMDKEAEKQNLKSYQKEVVP